MVCWSPINFFPAAFVPMETGQIDTSSQPVSEIQQAQGREKARTSSSDRQEKSGPRHKKHKRKNEDDGALTENQPNRSQDKGDEGNEKQPGKSRGVASQSASRGSLDPDITGSVRVP